MATTRICDDRVRCLNDHDSRDADFVMYWMQQSQRAECNHALEFAVQRANSLNKRLLVAFAIMEDYPESNLRHYRFMLEGLQQVETSLEQRKIKFVVQQGSPPDVVTALSKNACEVVCDRGYLRHQNLWRDEIAGSCECKVWQVEADAIVPVAKASDKREYAARTIRSKLNNLADDYLTELSTTAIQNDSLQISIGGLDLSDLDPVLDSMSINRSVKPSTEFHGGTSQAKAHLKSFLADRLSVYGDRTAILDTNASMLSPYLHFGQISSIAVANEVNSSRGHERSQKEAFLEELLVRRELAINFVHYEKDYDKLSCLPSWAAETLAEHEADEREHHYTSTELEAAKTHDPAWNAAMTEMKQRGYLHNHLRMYWGKKIIEWTNTTGHAYRTALELNNRYFLDGRDANSYTNVLWLFGLHDRAHQERKVFGKVRYMSFEGLKRKCDVGGYVNQIADRYGVDIESDDKNAI